VNCFAKADGIPGGIIHRRIAVLQFLDTPGHARHHVAILDTRSGHVFAGDVFGLSYREMDQGGRQFIVQGRAWEHDGIAPVLRVFLSSGHAESDTVFG